MVSEVVNGLKANDPVTKQSPKAKMKSVGGDFAQGFIDGMSGKVSSVRSTAVSMGKKAVEGLKEGIDSNSPSKLTMEAGNWFGEGMVIGIDQMGKKVHDAGYNIGDTATNALSSSISKIADVVNADMDVQPVISPVLDLSNVRTGAAAMSGMLDMDSSIGVLANVNGISRAMNLRGQNGANDDVISAIDKLNKNIANLSNTTYQVNGITYDDGSNITAAVADLVRAARIERRV
jgi:hypothetical protein